MVCNSSNLTVSETYWSTQSTPTVSAAWFRVQTCLDAHLLEEAPTGSRLLKTSGSLVSKRFQPLPPCTSEALSPQSLSVPSSPHCDIFEGPFKPYTVAFWWDVSMSSNRARTRWDWGLSSFSQSATLSAWTVRKNYSSANIVSQKKNLWFCCTGS